MKKLFDIFKTSLRGNVPKRNFHNFPPLRAIRYQDTLKWVKPEEVPLYHPIRSGDLSPITSVKKDAFILPFRDSKELQTANEKVKKVFSLSHQNTKSNFYLYLHDLVEKVKTHPYEKNSLEISIAKLTARIRFYQEIIPKRQRRIGSERAKLNEIIGKRYKLLKFLRQEDYKKFEWLIETLDLEYKPPPEPNVLPTRRNSIMLLAKLKVEKSKEEKLAKLKKSFDEQKIPFLENKVIKLKEIKEKEEKYNLPVTVTDADIEECIKKIENVKAEIAERQKMGYKRKIHPYFLEPYYEDYLIKKEKDGEKVRESMVRRKSIINTETSFVE